MSAGISKQQIAARAAAEVADGMVVNLGIGIPSLVSEYLRGKDVLFHSENGLIGMGPRPPAGQEDPDIVDAGKQPVTIVPGGSICSQAESFALIRSGHLDMTILGAFQVSEKGDIANWQVPGGSRVPGVGGAMDLVTGARRVVVTMTHVAEDGARKILKECTFPLTGRRCVDTIITDLAVMKVTAEGLVLAELAPGLTVEAVQAVTEPRLVVAGMLKVMCVETELRRHS